MKTRGYTAEVTRFLRACALLCALCVLCAGCGDDASSTGTVSDGGAGVSGGGTGGSGGGGGTGGSSGGCLPSTAGETLVSPRMFSNGSVIYRISLDDTHAYYTSIDTLYRVPLAGGEPEQLYTRASAIVIPFWLRSDDILLLEGSDSLVSIPKSGGESTPVAELPYRVSGSLDGRVDMIVEGDLAWAKSEARDFLGDTPTVVTFFEIDLTSGDTRVIHEGELGENSLFVKQGDALYTATQDPSVVVEGDGFGVIVPDLLYRLPLAGGEPELLSTGDLRMAFNVFAADDDALYFFATTDSAIMKQGIYRVDLAGGQPEQLVETIVLFNLTFEHERTPTQHIVRSLDTFYAISPGGGAARELFCMQDDVHSAAATDDAVWVGVINDDDEASIVKVAID